MICITVVVPSYPPEFSHTARTDIVTITEFVRETAYQAAKRLSSKDEISPKDFWVFVQTAYTAPAIKVTLEMVENVNRDRHWRNSVCEAVTRVLATRCLDKTCRDVVCFARTYPRDDGFFEIKDGKIHH